MITLAIRPISSFLSTAAGEELHYRSVRPHLVHSLLAIIHQSSVSHQHQPSAISISHHMFVYSKQRTLHCRASSAHSSPPHVFIVVLRCSPIPSMHKECCASAVLTPFISFCVAAKIPNSDYSALSSLPCDPPFEPSPLLGLPFVLGCFPGWPPAF